MNNLIKILSISFLIFLISGCSSKKGNYTYDGEYIEESKDSSTYMRYYKKYNGYDGYDTWEEPMINYNYLSNEAVKQLFKNYKVPKKIIVTDFVDLSSLKNNSNLGYILSNSIKNSLINVHKANVVESEISKYFKLSANGLRLLTRDVNKVKSTKYDVENAVVGTYTYNEKELIIFVKLINLKTGIIKGSYANSLLIGEGRKFK